MPFSLSDRDRRHASSRSRCARIRRGWSSSRDLPPEVPRSLVGDPVRLRQVLTNLVGNAIKFTERGHVVLDGARRSRATARRVLFAFQVTDTGIGIPAEKHAQIFEAFSQADGSTTRRFGGTGLGLAISSSLVSMMGGRIAVRASSGRAARLPSMPASASSTVTTCRSARRAWRTCASLVVDDNEVNRAHLRGAADAMGHAADERHRRPGRDRCAWRPRQARAVPLILLDAQMPDVDGFAVAAEVAGEPDLAGTRS